MPFSDPVVAGTELIRESIQSPNYVPGSSGWSINADGTAEFRSVTAEGFLLLADGQVTEAKIATGAVTENKIATSAVTNAKIAGAAVDGSKLADGSVDAAKIVAGSVGTNQLGPDAVTNAKLADLAVGGENLQAGSVTTAKLAAGAVTANEISANAIVAGKISAGAVGATELAANAVVAGKIAAGAVDALTLNANTITGASISGTTMTVSGNSAIVQAVDGNGIAVGSINSDGVGSFSALTIADDNVSIAGQQLSDRLASQAASILAFGLDTSTSANTTGELGIFEIAFVAPESKYYQVVVSAWLAGNATADGFLSLRDGGSSKPSISSTRVLWAGHGFAQTGIGEQFGVYAPVYFTAGQHRLLLSFGRYSGAGTVYFTAATTQPGMIQVMDTPAALANIAVANTGGGGSSPVVQTYTRTWQATWSASYDGSNAYLSYLGNTCYQGSYDGSSGNNRRSQIGFDSASITSELSGATILGCSIRLYSQHWYWNAGGTAIIGSHSNASRPASFTGATTNRIQSSSWPKPGVRSVDIMGIGLPWEFQSGAAKGITLGPAPSLNYEYYGYFAGAGMDWDPQLTITYQK